MQTSCLTATEVERYPECSLSPEVRPARRLWAKRVFDVAFSALGLIVLSPVLLVIAVLIKLSGGPIFYRQRRVGLHGAEFQIYKFRTMSVGADMAGPGVTRGGDARVTRLGRFLRKLKFDELPQLWNVLRGEMSFVGPRPEVPCYVNAYTPAQRMILSYKPGITDLATLFFRDEESLLRNARNVEEFYIQQCIPRKVQLNLHYARRANLFSDTWIILQTVCPFSLGVLLIYGSLLSASLWLSFQLAGNSAPRLSGFAFLAIVCVKLAALAWRHQYKGLLSYFSFPELRQSCIALGVSFLVLLASAVVLPANWLPPVNVLVIDLILSLALLGTFRMSARLWRERSLPARKTRSTKVTRVGIIGASEAGAHLAREIATRKHLRRKVEAFFDDNVHKWQKRLHEVPVVGMPECLLEGWGDKLDEVVIAMPDASADRLHEIKELVQRAKFKCYNCPSVEQIWST